MFTSAVTADLFYMRQERLVNVVLSPLDIEIYVSPASGFVPSAAPMESTVLALAQRFAGICGVVDMIAARLTIRSPIDHRKV
jgi:hypothetical protein